MTDAHARAGGIGRAQRAALHLAVAGGAVADQRAFEDLYRQSGAHLYAVAMRIVRDASVAEEILQEAFVSVWHHAGSYDAAKSQPVTWLTSIVRNRCLDQLRRREVDTVTRNAATTTGAGVRSCRPTDRRPSSCCWRGADARAVRDCVDTLDAGPKQAIALAFFQGLSHARARGTPARAARHRQVVGPARARETASLSRRRGGYRDESVAIRPSATGWTRLAAEYALGTSPPRVRRRLSAIARRDNVVAAALTEWERRIAVLAEQVPAIAPPPRVWQRIAERLGMDVATRDVPSAWWRRMGFWRVFAAASFLVAVGLAVSEFARPPTPAAAPLVVVLAGADAKPALIATAARGDRYLTLKTVTNAAPGEGKVFELWALPQGGTPEIAWRHSRGWRRARAVDGARGRNADGYPGARRQPGAVRRLAHRPADGSGALLGQYRADVLTAGFYRRFSA